MRLSDIGAYIEQYSERDAGGYFRIFSETFARRFFVEIIQRPERCDAYGALNAPAYMTSQAQRAPDR